MGNEQSTISNMDVVESPEEAGAASESAARPRLTSTSNDNQNYWSQVENCELVLDSLPVDPLLTPRNAPALNDKTPTGSAATANVKETKVLLPLNENVPEKTKVEELKSVADKEKPEEDENENDKENENENESSLPVLSASASLTLVDDHSDMKLNQRAREQSLEEFKEELKAKRLARQTAVQDLRDEITSLRQQLAQEQALRLSAQGLDPIDRSQSDPLSRSPSRSHSQPRSQRPRGTQELVGASGRDSVPRSTQPDEGSDDADDVDPLSRSRHANIELANAQLSLQLSQADNLSLRTELGVVQKQVGTLKEVVSCVKQMLAVREEQCDQLKAKLREIEDSMSEKETKIMSTRLREEYERQLENMRQLKQLYDDRQRVANTDIENLQRLLAIRTDELKNEQQKSASVEEQHQTLTKTLCDRYVELGDLREECNALKFENKALKEEIGAVNTLFTQMVLGFKGTTNLDIDRLTTLLEENRVLLNEMTANDGNSRYGATLPKLLFELVEQVALMDPNNAANTSTAATSEAEKSATTADGAVGRKNEADNEAEESEESEEDENENEDEEEFEDAQEEVTANNEEAGDTRAAADATDFNHGAAFGNNVAASTVTEATAESGATSLLSASGTNDAVSQVKKTENPTTSTNTLNEGVAETSNPSPNSTTCTQESSSMDPIPTEIPILNTSNNNSNTKPNKKTLKRGATGKKNKGLQQNGTHGNGTAVGGGKTMKFHEPEVLGKVVSAQEIIGNLPKVWKVLIELLSHHNIVKVESEEKDCYKVVETPTGPKPEISVSKTYIRLKDLILEKKSLVKETNRLKALNSHLEFRLNEQEARLSTVSLELTKTWHLVGKMQRQHRQLHTQEQILRYQLQQKRRLLNELKDELEFCRRRWALARAKNEESQQLFDEMRRDNAQRKLDDANQSGESGYSDCGQQSDDDERTPALKPYVPKPNNIDESQAKAEAAVKKHDDKDTENNRPSTSGAQSHTSRRMRSSREMFEHTRKIKRMQSSSPRRSGLAGRNSEKEGSEEPRDNEEIVLRWNSAPPTCGWYPNNTISDVEDPLLDDDDTEADEADDDDSLATAHSQGAIPKAVAHNSRAKKRHQSLSQAQGSVDSAKDNVSSTLATVNRIELLKEQCKSLIQKVLETSDNRERLEVQLCRFQDEIAPVQYAVPLDDFITNKRLERMTRASSAPASGCLTPREEEYTRKRSERLGRLEEESRQLISRIKRTSDRGHFLRCSLDRIRRAPPHEESFESNTEEEPPKAEKNLSSDETSETKSVKPSPLTEAEEAYTARRRARLQRLEEEGQLLVARLSRNVERGETLETRMDQVHQRCLETEAGGAASTSSPPREPATSIEKRLEDIENVSKIRAERLKALEEEGKQLLSRLTNTSEKGTQMINRIAERERRKELKDQEEAAAAILSNSIKLIDATNIDPLEGASGTTVLLPTPNTVACSSIVGEELADSVQVTTTSSRIASNSGAIPKSKPLAELSLHARAKQKLRSNNKSEDPTKDKTQTEVKEQAAAADEEESIEAMIKRLKNLPFPSENPADEPPKLPEATQAPEHPDATSEPSSEQNPDD